MVVCVGGKIHRSPKGVWVGYEMWWEGMVDLTVIWAGIGGSLTMVQSLGPMVSRMSRTRRTTRVVAMILRRDRVLLKGGGWRSLV